MSEEQGQSQFLSPQRRKELAEAQRVLFERINVAEAWQITQGDPAILVGVIDGGFDYFHPDLKGRVIPGLYYSGGYHTEFYQNIGHALLWQA